jgi:pyruvate carboxylase
VVLIPNCRKIILKDIKPFKDRPNEHLKPINFGEEMKTFNEKFGNGYTFNDLLSYLLYPKVFEEYHEVRKEYGDVWLIPTPYFFYGLKDDEEAIVEIDKGKSVLVRLLTCSEPDKEGKRKVFMRLNGQTRIIEVQDKQVKVTLQENEKADKTNKKHISASLQGKLSQILLKEGEEVKLNQPLFVVEAMKMETTITATAKGKINRLVLEPGKMVKADDLVLVME